MNAEFWKQQPPSARDFEIYRQVRIDKDSTRQVAADWELSQTRIVQIVGRVQDFMRQTAPVEKDEHDKRHRQQVWIAETIGAERVDRAYGNLRRELSASLAHPCSKVADQCRLSLMVAKLAVIGSKLAASSLWDLEAAAAIAEEQGTGAQEAAVAEDAIPPVVGCSENEIAETDHAVEQAVAEDVSAGEGEDCSEEQLPTAATLTGRDRPVQEPGLPPRAAADSRQERGRAGQPGQSPRLVTSV